MKCFQRKLTSAARPGSKLWVEVEIPPGVKDALGNKEYPLGLFWGYWNRYQDWVTDHKTAADEVRSSGMWPDWVVVMDDGSRRRVRLISDTTTTCPSGPCGEKSEYVLFSAVEAEKAKLDGTTPREMGVVDNDGNLPIYQDRDGISFCWEESEVFLSSEEEMKAFFEAKGYCAFEEKKESSDFYSHSSGSGSRVEKFPAGSIRIRFQESGDSTRHSSWAKANGFVFVKAGEVRVVEWYYRNGPKRWSGSIYKVAGGKADLIGTYDPQAAEKKAFAAEQIRILKEELSLSERIAYAVLRAAGPGRAVEAARIAIVLSKRVQGDASALCRSLEHVARGGDTGYGKDRMRAAAEDLGLPSIGGNAGSISRVLSGVVAGIRAGIPVVVRHLKKE